MNQGQPQQDRITTMNHRTTPIAILVATTISLTSCGPDPFYLPSLAAGQLDVILKSTPITSAIESSTLNEDQIRKLELILDVRQYAIKNMNLEARDSFTHFVDVSETARLFNVSASHADQLRALTWSFPVVGVVPYLGFFDETLATQQETNLIDQGFDTFTYEVDAYSTLSFLPNPVRSTLLNRDDVSIVDTVIHELLHNTVYRPNDTDFNESLATFVGRTGAVEYIRDRFPENTAAIDYAITRNEDNDRYVNFILNFQNDLIEYYATNTPSEDRIANRESMFQSARDDFATDVQPLMHHPEDYNWVKNLPTNNAWILVNFRYNLDLDLFADVYNTTGNDWSTAITLYQSAARTTDPKSFLRNHINNPETTPITRSLPHALETRARCCKPLRTTQP